MTKKYDLGVVFTGHMMDAPDRKEPRFPATMYQDAGDAIRESLKDAWMDSDRPLLISSAARGADIIALEIAQSMGWETHIVLPFDVEEFVKRSIGDPDPFCWERRMRMLLSLSNDVTVLPGTGISEDFAAVNTYMAKLADDCCSQRKLMAFWDLKPGGGIGGTEHFVNSFREGGGQVEVIDAQTMLHLHRSDLAAPVSIHE